MSQEHRIQFDTRKLGGSPIRGGGTYRCSEVYCSCGWEAGNYNGQTHAESRQEATEHLKTEGVWTTAADQEVYSWVPREGAVHAKTGEAFYTTAATIAEKTGRSYNIVMRSLNKLEERGNVVKQNNGNAYYRTEKPFCWGI